MSGNVTLVADSFVCPSCRGLRNQEPVLEEVEVDGTQFEVVSQFRYLGDMLEENGGCEVAVSRRLRAGWAKFRELAGVVAAKDIPHHLKGFIYQVCTSIRPVSLYGCETWPLRLEDEKRLQR